MRTARNQLLLALAVLVFCAPLIAATQPVHAAHALGSADPLALLPKTYAWWLRRREEVRKISPVP